MSSETSFSIGEIDEKNFLMVLSFKSKFKLCQPKVFDFLTPSGSFSFSFFMYSIRPLLIDL